MRGGELKRSVPPIPSNSKDKLLSGRKSSFTLCFCLVKDEGKGIDREIPGQIILIDFCNYKFQLHKYLMRHPGIVVEIWHDMFLRQSWVKLPRVKLHLRGVKRDSFWFLNIIMACNILQRMISSAQRIFFCFGVQWTEPKKNIK